MSVSLKVKHGIYHMLQHTGTCHVSFFGHMTYDKDRYALSLGNLHQDIGGLSYLRNTSRCRTDILIKHSLYGIDHNGIRLLALDHFADRFQICLTQKLQLLIKFSDSFCAELDLAQGFLS